MNFSISQAPSSDRDPSEILDSENDKQNFVDHTMTQNIEQAHTAWESFSVDNKPLKQMIEQFETKSLGPAETDHEVKETIINSQLHLSITPCHASERVTSRTKKKPISKKKRS